MLPVFAPVYIGPKKAEPETAQLLTNNKTKIKRIFLYVIKIKFLLHDSLANEFKKKNNYV